MQVAAVGRRFGQPLRASEPKEELGVSGEQNVMTAQPARDQGGKRSVLPLCLFTLPGQLGEVRGASLRRPRHHRVDSKRIMLVLFFFITH